MPLTKSQVDKLGKQLSHSEFPDPGDLNLLDAYQREFVAAQVHVVEVLRRQLGLQPTVRMKTVNSIVAKLRREHTALSRMQDIAGCRVVVEYLVEQDEILDRLRKLPWDAIRVEDRRAKPSHGYRAVHVIVTTTGARVEIQVRTRVQDTWAQLSEKLADRFGLDVKYGRGPAEVGELLIDMADWMHAWDELGRRLAVLRASLGQAGDPERLNSEEQELELQALETDVGRLVTPAEMLARFERIL
jgi:ppGpp synthetase/RelA/SpoT-type nucleotidyltranferase